MQSCRKSLTKTFHNCFFLVTLIAQISSNKHKPSRNSAFNKKQYFLQSVCYNCILVCVIRWCKTQKPPRVLGTKCVFLKKNMQNDRNGVFNKNLMLFAISLFKLDFRLFHEMTENM